MLEQDGTPVMWARPMAECQTLKLQVEDAQQDVRGLQADLTSAGPGERAAIVKQIRQAQEKLREAKRVRCLRGRPTESAVGRECRHRGTKAPHR